MELPIIYLIDINVYMTEEWRHAFGDCKSVQIVNTDFESFMKSHPDVKGIVSPANSFGIMDGGYDAAITGLFGEKLYMAVQEKILEEYFGEQPIGTCLLVDIPDSDKKLLHSPSMRTPEMIIDPRVIYSCMRTTLVTAVKNNIGEIVVPAFGGLTGNVRYDFIADLMRKAFDDVAERINNKRYNTWRTIAGF